MKATIYPVGFYFLNNRRDRMDKILRRVVPTFIKAAGHVHVWLLSFLSVKRIEEERGPWLIIWTSSRTPRCWSARKSLGDGSISNGAGTNKKCRLFLAGHNSIILFFYFYFLLLSKCLPSLFDFPQTNTKASLFHRQLTREPHR